MGMIFVSFHTSGIMLRFRARLKIFVRYWMARGSRCFKWRMFMFSGPVELLFEDFEIASLTWIVVMIMGVVGRVLVWLSIRLFLALMVYLTVLTNCSLKAVAFSCGSVASLPLKLMAMLGCEGSYIYI